MSLSHLHMVNTPDWYSDAIMCGGGVYILEAEYRSQSVWKVGEAERFVPRIRSIKNSVYGGTTSWAPVALTRWFIKDKKCRRRLEHAAHLKLSEFRIQLHGGSEVFTSWNGKTLERDRVIEAVQEALIEIKSFN